MRREFGLSRAEFLRSLHCLSPDLRSSDTAHWRLPWPPGEIEIRLGTEHQRRLGALCLPSLPVEFRFHALTDTQRADFLHQFERAFQRGGG